VERRQIFSVSAPLTELRFTSITIPRFNLLILANLFTQLLSTLELLHLLGKFCIEIGGRLSAFQRQVGL